MEVAFMFLLIGCVAGGASFLAYLGSKLAEDNLALSRRLERLESQVANLLQEERSQ
jgi:hypothetical protein